MFTMKRRLIESDGKRVYELLFRPFRKKNPRKWTRSVRFPFLETTLFYKSQARSTRHLPYRGRRQVKRVVLEPGDVPRRLSEPTNSCWSQENHEGHGFLAQNRGEGASFLRSSVDSKVLYLPLFWWHEVRTLQGPSVSVTYRFHTEERVFGLSFPLRRTRIAS